MSCSGKRRQLTGHFYIKLNFILQKVYRHQARPFLNQSVEDDPSFHKVYLNLGQIWTMLSSHKVQISNASHFPQMQPNSFRHLCSVDSSVHTIHTMVLGSDPKHTIYAFIVNFITIFDIRMKMKQKEVMFGPYLKKPLRP